MVDFMAGGDGAFNESSDHHGGTIVSQGSISVDLLHVSRDQIFGGFDSLLSPVSSAGTYSGGFDFGHDGNAYVGHGVWAVGVGSDGPIGHGPGSGSGS